MIGEIRRVSVAEARPLVQEYHYSKNLPAGKNVCFGWFTPDDNSLVGETLYAVAVFGIGSNNNVYGYFSEITGLECTDKNLYELKRLVRSGSKEEKQVSLSQMLSVCHRSLLKENGIRYIISYSDPEFNPSGGIYAASNFTLLGYSKPETDILDADGLKINRRTLLHWRNRNGHPTIDEACAILGYTKVKTPQRNGGSSLSTQRIKRNCGRSSRQNQRRKTYVEFHRKHK